MHDLTPVEACSEILAFETFASQQLEHTALGTGLSPQERSEAAEAVWERWRLLATVLCDAVAFVSRPTLSRLQAALHTAAQPLEARCRCSSMD